MAIKHVKKIVGLNCKRWLLVTKMAEKVEKTNCGNEALVFLASPIKEGRRRRLIM